LGLRLQGIWIRIGIADLIGGLDRELRWGIRNGNWLGIEDWELIFGIGDWD